VKARGFTLVEMLVAVAVLAIALAAILSGMARYASNAGYLREKSVALWVAHNRLAQFELQAAWPDVGKSDGDVEMAGAKWKWIAEVKKTSDDHLRRIDVSVQPAQRKTDLVTISAFIADTGRQ
jgi:general secretion pathway protein I